MKQFNIEMFNKHENKVINKQVSVISFPEAAKEAYVLRTSLGFDWEIQAITSVKKNK